MTITTKENANGRICAYYIDGVKTRKGEIEYFACNPTYDGIIEIDYHLAKDNFKNLFNDFYAVVFKNWLDGSTVMTANAAKKLGLKLGKRVCYKPAIYRVEMPAIEADLDDYAVTPDAQDVATDAEIQAATATDEIANVEVELPKGHITVESGAHAFELVSNYFPNGLRFCKASKGFNREDVFSYSDDKERLFAIATCTPDNSRVEVVEVIDTNESGSKRKLLFIVIEHQAARDLVTYDVETQSVDGFDNKLAQLTAERNAAKVKQDESKAAYDAACYVYEEKRVALQNFLDGHAKRLTENLQSVTANLKRPINLTKQGEEGTLEYSRFDITTVNAFNAFGKRFIIQLGAFQSDGYDTPEQVTVVINRLKAAITRGDKEFSFPTIAELNKPYYRGDTHFTCETVNKAIKRALEDRKDVFDGLEKAYYEVPQSFIDYLNSAVDILLRDYCMLVTIRERLKIAERKSG